LCGAAALSAAAYLLLDETGFWLGSGMVAAAGLPVVPRVWQSDTGVFGFYWIATSFAAFIMLGFTFDFGYLDIPVFNQDPALPGILLISIMTPLLLVLRRRKYTGLELAVGWVWTGVSGVLLLFLFVDMGVAPSIVGGSEFRTVWTGFNAAVIVMLVLVIRRWQRLTGPEVAVYWFGASLPGVWLVALASDEYLAGATDGAFGFILGITVALAAGGVIVRRRWGRLTAFEASVYTVGLAVAFPLLLISLAPGDTAAVTFGFIGSFAILLAAFHWWVFFRIPEEGGKKPASGGVTRGVA
jgi:hypothetical protein